MKILVDSTMLNNLLVIDNFNGKTFGELKTLLEEKGAIGSNMKVVIGETRNTLEVDSAVLPEMEEITLFITPVDTKAGNISEKIEEVKSLLDEISKFIEGPIFSEEEKTESMAALREEIRNEFIDNAIKELQKMKTKNC